MGVPVPLWFLVSCRKDSNITMGRFRITVDRYLKLTGRDTGLVPYSLTPSLILGC